MRAAIARAVLLVVADCAVGLAAPRPTFADAPRVVRVVSGLRLYSKAVHYDVRLLDQEDRGPLLQVVERTKTVPRVVSSLDVGLGAPALHFRVVRDRGSGIVFVGILWRLRYGFLTVFRIDRPSLRLTPVLDAPAGRLELARGRVREVQMAKYLFGLDALPKGVRGGDAYWRWQTYSPRKGRFVAGRWHRHL